jgi:ATP-binding cassette subfamily B protein/subfamily B ATP-binding cassette protein MsbA
MTVVPAIQTEDLPQKGFDPLVTRQIFGFLSPYKLALAGALSLMIITAAAAAAGPYITKVALDSGLAQGNPWVLRDAVLVYTFTAVLQWVTVYYRVMIMAWVGQSIIFDLRDKMFAHLQELSLGFFSRYSVGRIIVRVINDVNVLREFITWALLAIFRDFLTIIFVVGSMLAMDFNLSLLTFTVLPFMVLVTVIFRKQARENYRATRAAISWVNSVLAENINAVRVVQSFSREDYNYNFFRNTVNQNNLTVNLKAIRFASQYFPTIDMLGTLALALAVWIGGTAVLGQQISAGVLVAFVMYISRFFEPIRDLSNRYDSFQSTMASGERIMALLATPVEVQDQPEAQTLGKIRGEVEFKAVDFHYSDDPAPILNEINLHIQPGETVAFVGKTGAGKTTLIKLLGRFHDVSGGQILVDGIDLRQITQQSLRSQMGIVLQDPFLFSGTVRENIRFGRLEASDSEIEEAAQAVGADEFIRKLRLGYETPVQEGGVILSVGQRQLISFARALLADPRILILDEATSSVDTQTERLIQNALSRLLKGRTSFVIAHRLSTIVNADRIVVIQDGKIVEQGTHPELLAQHGVYYNLYSMRFEEE